VGFVGEAVLQHRDERMRADEIGEVGLGEGRNDGEADRRPVPAGEGEETRKRRRGADGVSGM
jgi:hypothetical protein